MNQTVFYTIVRKKNNCRGGEFLLIDVFNFLRLVCCTKHKMFDSRVSTWFPQSGMDSNRNGMLE